MWPDSTTPPVDGAGPSPIPPASAEVSLSVDVDPIATAPVPSLPPPHDSPPHDLPPHDPSPRGLPSHDPLARNPLSRGSISTIEEARSCGIVLSDPSYYTVPPLDECDDLTSDGACVVTNFTIGHQDYGEIYFPGSTDIFGLNLDKIGVCNV